MSRRPSPAVRVPSDRNDIRGTGDKDTLGPRSTGPFFV